jgi:ubiquinone/menaquinone biosynthesis C-methylase UbiE
MNYGSDGSMAYRLRALVEELKQRVRIGGRILDFGSGAGDIAARCGQEGYKVDGIDPSVKMVERAKSRFSLEGVDFISCADTLKLPFADETFDGIVASSVLEYVSRPQEHLRELRRVCKDGGYQLLTVPNMGHPIRWVEAAEKRLLGSIRGRLPPTWRAREEYLALSVNRYSVRKWKKLLARAGWIEIAMKARFAPLRLVIVKKGATSVASSAKPV